MKSLRLAAVLCVSGILGLSSVSQARVKVHYGSNSRLGALSETRLAAQDPVIYFGGPVLSNVKIVAVFWGPAVDAQVQSGIGGFYTAVTNSNYMDWMNEYNTKVQAVDGRAGTQQSIGRGSYAGSIIITPKNTGVKLDKTDVEAELEYQIEQGKLPVPDANTLYMVHFPQDIDLLTGGELSCVAWCADHEGFVSKKYGNIAYAMMPDVSKCLGGCGADNVFDASTLDASHELAESVSDPMCPDMNVKPAFPAAWLNTTEEIGDICVSEPVTTLTAGATQYKVQAEWSNERKSCYNGPFTSSVSIQ